jgi:hypothetical protein
MTPAEQAAQNREHRPDLMEGENLYRSPAGFPS